MPHQEFVGLPKKEKQQVPHSHDKIIDIEGHPRLKVGFRKSRYKVPDHGVTKSEKIDETALLMMQLLQDMPRRLNLIWFDQNDVTYQGEINREFPAILIFDYDTKIAAVFNKQTGNFITTYQLTKKQKTKLKMTHNFCGGEGRRLVLTLNKIIYLQKASLQ
uniref:hypothetical protein n=1 Tax=Nitzschia traheaformis TaxID=1881117 RepID=UPI001EF9F760|nr:hypothetical protein MKU15_pgp025 [Nitzschia traheaformis]ULD15930.1 hypothetical protein [Nitzschia traheaformis]